MSGAVPHTSSCTNLERVTFHRKSNVRRLILTSLVVLAYALVLPGVYSTMGAPLARAVEQAEALRRNGTVLLETEAKEPEEAEASWSDEEDDATQVDPVGTVKEDGDFPLLSETDLPADANATKPAERPLPSEYLPDALPLFLLFACGTFHALFHLLCRWFVWFRVATTFEPVPLAKLTAAGPDLVAYVEAKPHRGRSDLCPVAQKKRKEMSVLEFEFQRQTYEYVFPSDLARAGLTERDFLQSRDADDASDVRAATLDAKTIHERAETVSGAIRLISAKADGLMAHYAEARGLQSVEEIEELRLKFGKNSVTVPLPPFTELLKTQLLMPLSIFQFFSSALWALDEYVQYVMFNLVMIVMMESTTAFQRHRTMQQLRGLQPRPFDVFVYRCGAWTRVSSEDLLPGDVASLVSGSVVPCDALILSGSAIVNEATLTGESVPQMKDAVDVSDREGLKTRVLDVDGSDRVHTLFSGTSLVASSGSSTSKFPMNPLNPNGCVVRVLRTGFGSSQGELMQMIEFSSQEVSADSKETGLALLILLIFALISASYVFKKGMEKGDRTTHELLLKCVIIVTSVVPRQLPIQMALAVNHALMTLMSEGIFCTEPYRVPQAGKVTHALFDKTGTLTSDELLPAGIVNASSTSFRRFDESDPETTIVLAGCHALVSVPGSNVLLGDPIELAALKGIEFAYDASTRTAKPGGNAEAIQRVMEDVSKRTQQARETNNASLVSTLTMETEKLLKQHKACVERAAKSVVERVTVLRHFHFEASLARMSVVGEVKRRDQSEPIIMVMVKGSPEAMSKLIVNPPEWYESVYKSMAEKGMRVLALASKVLPKTTSKPVEKLDRNHDVERDLSFAGFVAFECKTRADSPAVIRTLIEADVSVHMLTGDAPLTALHVSSVCGFTEPTKRTALVLNKTATTWNGALTKHADVSIPFDATSEGGGLRELVAKGYDLLVTEEALDAAATASQGKLWSQVDAIAVFARMSPRGKARVIRQIQKKRPGDRLEKHVLMCGDGGNDVGALKQADVGLALLSGYGSANTEDKKPSEETTPALPAGSAEEALNATVVDQKKRTAHAMKLKAAEFEMKRKELVAKQREWMQEELDRLPPGFSSSFTAMKNATARMRDALAKESRLLDIKHGLVTGGTSGSAGLIEAQEAALAGAEQGMPQIRPGDASVAAPFTSRIPSVRSVVHLLRQGRCTLLSAMQQQQIMMLECTITAYTYAAISLEGSRSSERQMMASGWLIMTASLAFSYAKPLERIHKVRPIKSLFHPSVVVSIVGQAVIHLWSLSQAVSMATERMGPEKLAEVVAFNKRVAARDTTLEDPNAETDPLAALTSLWAQPFLPNLINTTVFLVETSEIMAVLFVNYKGRPFMKGILENHALFLSLFLCIGGVAFCAWEVLPQANRAIHLIEFPDDEYRFRVMGHVAACVVGTFVWDRLATWMFAPEVFAAMVESAKETSVMDLLPMFESLAKVAVGLSVFGTGNPLVWGAAYMANNKYKAWRDEQEARRMGLIGPAAAAT